MKFPVSANEVWNNFKMKFIRLPCQKPFKNIVQSGEHSYGPIVDLTKLVVLFEQWSHRAHFPICRVTVFNGIVKNACKRLGNSSCHVLHQLCWDHLVTMQATYAHWSLSVSFQREIYLCDEFTEASEFVCAPVFKDCFDTLMISKILTIILFFSQRYIISHGNKVFIEQFGNFLFVSNNPVFFF